MQSMRNRPLKETLQQSVQALETRIAALREHLAVLKNDVIEGCQNALTDFRTRGAAALDGIARFFHLKHGLEAMRAGLDESIRTTEKVLAKIEAASAEYHEAGRHLKNMGRAAVREARPGGKLMKAVQAPAGRNAPALRRRATAWKRRSAA